MEIVRVIPLQPGGTVEGMVADDETSQLYLTSESGGLWEFGASQIQALPVRASQQSVPMGSRQTSKG